MIGGKIMSKKKTKSSFESFEGVYCSGFFIKNPALVTAMCLLFEKIHILNHLEYVINFSKKFQFVFPQEPPPFIHDVVYLEPVSPEDEEENPFHNLTLKERQTANTYLNLASRFIIHYSDLFGEVLHSSLIPSGKVLDVQLVKKGVPGRKNTYCVKMNPLVVSTDSLNELDNLISRGAVPVLDKYRVGTNRLSNETLRPRYLASLLAMKSVELILPQTKAADGKTILEARERLKDYLPPFWSSMLKLSIEFKARLEEGISALDLQRECEDIIDTTVRPALIDINQELLKERKNWFHKIITPVAKGLKVIVGKPPVTTADLISSGLALGANVTLDVADQIRKVNAISQESGLTFLLELEKFMRKD